MKIMDDLKVDRETPLGKLVVDSSDNSKQNAMTEADVKAAKQVEVLIVD